MKYFVLITSMLTMVTCLTSCTYNVSMSHTSGGSTDTMEETASNTPDVSPTITVPVSALPGGSILPSIPVSPVTPK